MLLVDVLPPCTQLCRTEVTSASYISVNFIRDDDYFHLNVVDKGYLSLHYSVLLSIEIERLELALCHLYAVSYTHLDVYKRQRIPGLYTLIVSFGIILK